MVKQLNRVIALLLAMTLVLSMGLALGNTQARYDYNVTWQSVYYPTEPKVVSNRLAENGQTVLLKEWVLDPAANTREYKINFHTNTDNIFGMFDCSANLDCVEASLSQTELKKGSGAQEITLTLHLKDEAYLLEETFPVSIHVSLQAMGDYNKLLWADFIVDLVPQPAQEETTAPTVVPEETTAPEEVPGETTAPEEVPEETTIPEEVPEETTVPEEVPEETTAPEEVPSETTAPAESETTTPPSESETTAPAEVPAETTAPEEPTVPVESPSETTVPEGEPVALINEDTEPVENEPNLKVLPTDQDPPAESLPLMEVEEDYFSWSEWVSVKIAVPADAEMVELLYNGAYFPAGTMCRRTDGSSVLFGDPMPIQLSAEEASNWDVLLNFKNIEESDKSMQMSITASASSGITRQIVDTQTVTLDASRIAMENVFSLGSWAVIMGAGEVRVPCDWNNEALEWHIEHYVRDDNGELTYVQSDDNFGLTFELEEWTTVLENGETVDRKLAVIDNGDGSADPGSYRLVLSRTSGMETYTAELPFFIHYKTHTPASEELGGMLQ